MKYNQHRHDGLLKPDEHFDPMGMAAPDLHELLERKGFIFQMGSDYYSFGKDDDWQNKPIGERPLICTYQSGTWDGRPIPGQPIKPGIGLREYLDLLPDVS